MKSEDRIQQDCVMWFRNEFPKLRGRLYSVPNGGLRNKREAMLLKSTGVYPGVSDLHLLVKEVINTENGVIKYPTTVYIELKTEIGVQSDDQEEWQRLVEDMGFIYYMIRTQVEFIKIVSLYYGEEDK